MGKICHYFFLLKGHDKIHHYIPYKIGAKMPLWQALNININKDNNLINIVMKEKSLEIHNFNFPIISPGYGPTMAGVLQTLGETYAICVAFYAWNVHANIVMNNLRIHNGYAAWARGCHVTDERNTCKLRQERAKYVESQCGTIIGQP